MLYTFKKELPTYTDGHIIVADNGSVFIEAGVLHIIEGENHRYYDEGWYIKGVDGKTYKLDEYAKPTATFVNETIADDEILAKITEVREDKEKEDEE